MLVKEDIVGEFNDCEEISIINAMTLMKKNYGFLKIYVLQIK